MKRFSKKLAKKPLALSPLSLAIAACGGGGGGGESSSSNQSSNSNSSTSTNYGSHLYSITSREMESNNTPKTSNLLKQTTFSGQSYSRTDDDYFQLNVPTWDVIKLTFSSNYWDSHEVSIIDSQGITLSSKSITYDGSIVARPYHDGEVYILVEGSDLDTEDYTISLSQSSGNYEMEPNDSHADADQIYNNTPIKGQSFSRTDDDYFVFTATSGTTTVSFSSDYWDSHQVKILNSAQQIMTQSSITYTDTITSATFIGQKYYVLVEGSDLDQNEYTLTLNPGSASNAPTNTSTTPVVASFKEQDTPATPNDYDWATLDQPNNTFVLHIEESDDYGWFDKAVADLLRDSSLVSFAILYRNTNSEDDPNGYGSNYSDYNWIIADEVTVVGDTGIQQYIQVKDSTLDQVVIDTGYDYISFAVNTGTTWIAEDFAVADVTIA